MIFQRLIISNSMDGQKRCSKTSKEPIILYVGLMSSHFDLIEFWSYFFWTKYVGTAIKLKQKQWVVKKCLLKVNSWLAMDYFRSIVASPASRLGFALFLCEPICTALSGQMTITFHFMWRLPLPIKKWGCYRKFIAAQTCENELVHEAPNNIAATGSTSIAESDLKQKCPWVIK